MSFSVIRNCSGAVKNNHRVKFLQGNVVNKLVNGALHKRRINAYNRKKSSTSKTATKRNSVFFCNSHIKKTMRIVARKRV